MAKAQVLVTYRINEHELMQCAVTASTSYPDALHEAKTIAVQAIHDMLAEAVALERTQTADG